MINQRFKPFLQLIIFAVTLCPLMAEEGSASPNVQTPTLQVQFSFKGANPVFLRSYLHSPQSKKVTKACFVKTFEPPLLQITVENNPSLQENINQLSYLLEREEKKENSILTFVSEYLPDSIRFKKTYIVSKTNHTFSYTLEVTGKNVNAFTKNNRLGIVLQHGECFTPPPSAGFSGSNKEVKTVFIKNNKVHTINRKKKKAPVDTLECTQWIGFRNNFWALLCRPLSEKVHIAADTSTAPENLSIALKPGQHECSLSFFAGPIEYTTLKQEKAPITGLLFYTQWFWMRWLCFGLLFLLNWLTMLIGNHGIAIILLSVCVKILMLPLVRIADKWQQDVNVQKSTLQPHIDDIKANYRGEEQNRRILQLHKEKKIHPLYTLKSLLSVLIQIPIFFAAYHMLDENIALSGVSFLWINDLALPDNLLRLPFVIPFFGEYLNLLPFLMTGITLLTSWKFRDSSLSKPLLKKQQQNLYWMALLFFILFYTFPAGMVLYWTTNNFTSLLKILFKRKSPLPGAPTPSEENES